MKHEVRRARRLAHPDNVPKLELGLKMSVPKLELGNEIKMQGAGLPRRLPSMDDE